MRNTIENYLLEKNAEHKSSGHEQFALKVCPSCGDDKYTHFYINVLNGLWDCKKCGAKGNYNHLRALYGDGALDLTEHIGTGVFKTNKKRVYNKPDPKQTQTNTARLFSVDTEILSYLKDKRLLKEETLKHFKVGSIGGKISIPIFYKKELVNIRYRRSPKEEYGAKYTQERNCKTELYNGDIIEEGAENVFIVEGEFDAMILWQKGIKNVISTTLGAGYFPARWGERLSSVKHVYLCYDTDEEGQNGAKKAASIIGESKCSFISLPNIAGKKKVDITEFFLSGKSLTDFKRLFTEKENKEIIHISELTPELRDKILSGETYGIPTGYTQLDEAMGGLRKGRMIVVSGLTSTGKSSFATCVSLQVAEMKRPILYYSLEMPPIDLAKRFLQIHSRLTGNDLKDMVDPSPELEKVDETLLALSGDVNNDGTPIYFYNGSGMIKFKNLEDSIKVGVEKHGIEFVVIDHLHYFTTNYNNLTNETSMIVRKIKQLAVSMDIPIMLLAHLNRGGRSSQRKGLYTPGLSDLRDTGAIEQDADQVLFVCRDSENEDREEREKAWIKVAKNRDGQVGVSISAIFNEEITYFEEQVGVHYEEDKKKEVEMLEATLDENNSGIIF